MSRHFVAGACSELPSATEAVGEIAGYLLESGYDRPDLLWLFVTRPFAGILEDVAPALQRLLSPAAIVGAGAHQIVAPDGWLTDQPAINVLAMNTGEVTTRRLRPGEPYRPPADSKAIVLADPYTYELPKGKSVTGAYASGAQGPGGNYLVLDTSIHRDGAIAVEIPDSHSILQVPRPSGLSVARYIDAQAMLLFQDLDLDYWHERFPDELYGEPLAPYCAGFVSEPPYNGSLSLFGNESWQAGGF